MNYQELLNETYPLSAEQVAFFQENGFIRLKNVLPPEVLAHYERIISNRVFAENNLADVPMEERDTYQKAFIQIINIWTRDETAKEFVFSRRLAGIASQLLGCEHIRLYHDQALYKEPFGGFTPWHADQYYWPLEKLNTCTVWIPFQETPLEMGPLAFAEKSQYYTGGRGLEISDESERVLGEEMQMYQYNEEPYELGEVSFHYGWTYHRAGANQTAKPRNVMTMIYTDDENLVMEPIRQEQINDRNNFLPNTQAGDYPRTSLNPLLY